jgi:hypothetical protein
VKKHSGERETGVIWGEHEINGEKVCSWRIGSLLLRYKRTADEVMIAYQYINPGDEKKSDTKEPPEDITWLRWTMKDQHSRIKLNPLFPDRPVVVKPESLFQITRGGEARIYVRVPLWLEVTIPSQKPIKLIDIPAVILSNTWFGTFFEGELCYWVSSSARREIDEDPGRPYLAICPIQLINEGEEDLPIEKICLRVENLSLFYNDVQLWSDETRVYCKSKEGVSQIKVAGSPPKEASSARLLTPPRRPLKKGLAAKTIASLIDLPGLGIPNR